MFYETTADNSFRFGDVISGFVFSETFINNPIKDSNYFEYDVKVKQTRLFVILSPCCSIGDSIILLSPLIKILPNFFRNPFFREAPSRMNEEVEPENTLPPVAWEMMPPEEKEKRLQLGVAYTNLEYFVFEGNSFFEEYEIKNGADIFKTSDYMIDFRNVCKINCDKIVKPHIVPLEAKILQLSVDSRSKLRKKISYYYGRVPEEDKVV